MASWRLSAVVAATMAGASFQFYTFGAANTPQDVVEGWINQTYQDRRTPLSGSALTVFWSFTVGCACLGAIFGSILTRTMAERLGRKGALLLNGWVTIVGSGLEAGAKAAGSPEMLIIGRFVLGFTNGVATGVVPMFFTEIAPVRRRGAVGAAHQIAVAFSDWFSLFLTLPQLLGSADLWPVAFAFPALPAFLMVLVLPFACESPRFLLITRGDRAAAEQSVAFYASDREFKPMLDGLVEEAAVASVFNGKVSMRDFLRQRELRTPLGISVMVMTAQQFTGCAALFTYSTSIFVQAGLTTKVAQLSTVAVGICYFLFTLPSPYVIEKLGRRKLSLMQLSGCWFFLVLLTIFISLRNRYGLEWTSYASIGVLLAYMACYGLGSSVPWIITTELFEQKYRSLGVSAGTFVAWFWSLVIAFGYYPFQQAVGVELSFLPFIIVLLLIIGGIALLLPETKNKSTYEIVREFRHRKKSMRNSTSRWQTSRETVSELSALLEETGEEDDEKLRSYKSIRG